MEAQKKWLLVKSDLKSKLSLDVYSKIVEPLKVWDIKDTFITLTSDSKLDLTEVKAYQGLMEHSLSEVTGLVYRIQCVDPPLIAKSSSSMKFGSLPPVELNPDFTFENFVVGSNSQFAYSACFAVASGSGGTQFNPLLLYGGVGLGKTHLMQAIGNHIQQNSVGKRVRYVTSESFYREFVDSLRDNKITELSNYYRTKVDVLLMDDIQFLAGKDRTQEEFFHIFNALHQVGRQIILTSDAPPNQLKGLEDRLTSRFQWGLFVDITPPDRETREAILKKKAIHLGLDISDEILSFLAEAIDDNVRILEGAIRQLMLQASLELGDITLDFAKEIVFRVAKKSLSKPVTLQDITDMVAEYFSVEVDKVLEQGRGTKEVAHARQVAMFLMKELTSASLKTIGKRFGDRDHSTVVHAIKTIEKAMQKDNSFKRSVDGIVHKLQTRT